MSVPGRNDERPALYLVLGDDGGEAVRDHRPRSPLKRLRNRGMDAVSGLLYRLGLHGTQGGWDAWCDQHGRWDR